MKIPLRPKFLKKFRRPWLYLVLHDLSCSFSGLDEFKLDTPKFQTNRLRTINLQLNKQLDLNFHFVIERINDDFEVMVGRPMSAICEYEDIPRNINDIAIHIGMMGNFKFYIPENRFYKVLAYRIITPLIQMSKINRTRIFTHDEISESNQKTFECPGRLFEKQRLTSIINEQLITN
jgi:hypothetical protein